MAIVSADGVLWEVEHGSHDELGPWHEQELTPQLLGLLPEGGVFLDVGAHVGHYALRAAKKASLVYAIEPNPVTAARLRENVELNELVNVRILQVAAWDGVGQFALRKVHEQYARDGSSRVVRAPDGPVWGARLDDVLSQYPLRPDRLDLVKVDVEGADLHAIEGMRGLIRKHQPVLIVEDHAYLGYYEQADLLALITSLGYDYENVTSDNATYWECRPSSTGRQ